MTETLCSDHSPAECPGLAVFNTRQFLSTEKWSDDPDSSATVELWVSHKCTFMLLSVINPQQGNRKHWHAGPIDSVDQLICAIICQTILCEINIPGFPLS